MEAQNCYDARSPQVDLQINTNPIKIPGGVCACVCVETDELILKCTWMCKGTKLIKRFLKRNVEGGDTWFQICKATVIKTM